MNLYGLVSSRDGDGAAAALSERLKQWHDAMVTHERAARRRGELRASCDEDCPHAEARGLWDDTVAMLGDRARELAFLRAKALGRQE